MYKKGFTLAEVLITLGVIGIVAAMTIPTLVANYQKKVWNTSAEVFDKKLTEALRVMNTQQVLIGKGTTEKFVEELSKHLKITKICQNNELSLCFSDTLYWGLKVNGEVNEYEKVELSTLKTASNFGQKEWGTNIIGIQVADGTVALVAYNPTRTCKQNPFSNEVDVQQCLAILYDTSGFSEPNTYAQDLNANKNVLTLGEACAFEIDGTCYSAPFYPEPITLEQCYANKEKYGISTCPESTDHWLGAVIACGGLENMPSESDLKAIKNQIYTNGSYDEDKARNLGFDISSEYYFRVWGNSEGTWNGMDLAFIWDYDPSNSRYYKTYRSLDTAQAICKIK